MILPTRRKLAREIADLKERVEGAEFLLSYLFFGDADDPDPRATLSAVTSPAPEAAAKVERESARARGGAAWRRS